MNALISVYNKAGIAEFAKELEALGWTIYASGGTAKEIQNASVKVKDIAELVGGEAILGHRVVTLSRQIHAGLLAEESSEHAAELKKLGIPRIDLVCVDMYPLSEAIAKGSTENEVIEQTDIGGPTMLHSAAKGRRIVLSKAEQRQEVIDWLKADQPEKDAFIKDLAASAEAEVAKYILQSAKYLSGDKLFSFVGQLAAVTKYGENPWQSNSALYGQDTKDPLALASFKIRGGTEPSFNNYADIDRLLQTITHIAAGFHTNHNRTPFIALGAKHGNVCGTAVADTPEEAIQKMLQGDLRAIFGGSIMLNFPVNKAVAELLLTHKVEAGKRLIDVVVASDVDHEAMEILQRKGGKLRLITNPELASLNKKSLDTARRFRYVRGGVLAQDNYTFVLNLKSDELAKHQPASESQEKDLLLAWAIGSTSNSNTITLVKDSMLIGNGVGQQDRVSAAELAIKRAKDAGHGVKGAVAYSDSFFPFPDGPQVLADAGIQAILTHSGSVGDKSVIETLAKAKVVTYTIPDPTARGFYAH